MTETSELLRAIVACTHRPNPTDPARIDVDPGKHKAFQEAIYQAEQLLSWPAHDAHRPSPQPIEGSVSDEAVEAAKDAYNRISGAGRMRAALEAALPFLPHLHPSPDNTGEGEPVAWKINGHDGWSITLSIGEAHAFRSAGYGVDPLYLHPPAADAVVEVTGEHVVTMTLREGRPPLYEWVKSLPYGVWPLFTREANTAAVVEAATKLLPLLPKFNPTVPLRSSRDWAYQSAKEALAKALSTRQQAGGGE